MLWAGRLTMLGIPYSILRLRLLPFEEGPGRTLVEAGVGGSILRQTSVSESIEQIRPVAQPIHDSPSPTICKDATDDEDGRDGQRRRGYSRPCC